MQDRRRFLKYLDKADEAMVKRLREKEQTLLYRERPMTKDAPVVLPAYLDRYN